MPRSDRPWEPAYFEHYDRATGSVLDFPYVALADVNKQAADAMNETTTTTNEVEGQ